MRPSRRGFVRGAAAALPGLALLRALPAFAEETVRPAPYLALQPFIKPGHDEFACEKDAAELVQALQQAFASAALPANLKPARSPFPASYRQLAPDLQEAIYPAAGESAQQGWARWVHACGTVRRASFYPLPGDLVRFEISSEEAGQRRYRTGHWKVKWTAGQLREFEPLEEFVASAPRPFFRDVTAHAFEHASSFREQLQRGVPYWRARLDPATGIDIYGSNGIAVGDVDGDGQDEIYVCQPGGLPNRLYKFAAGGQLNDITDAWGAGILDDTASALFLDLRNSGRQDLVVLRSAGPVLLVNEGSRFRLRDDAFHFASAPAGNFTGMAAADYDREGRLDLYLCCYVYFQSEAQYTYAAPYHDAQNGPPNFLFRNHLDADGGGHFEDTTNESGLQENNNRFSFAPAWCDFNDDGWPDLYVANDFGRKNLYLNKEGRFRDRAAEAGVEDIGPGMSAAWFDYDRDGRADLYVANMWTSAGQRVVKDPAFKPARAAGLERAYARHTMGNSLYRNRGDGTFADMGREQHATFGRWAWSAGGHDFDNDGNPEIFVTCGMLTNTSETDLGSFFWRQVVAQSPPKQEPSAAYENGWNAINQFIREEYSWNGREPNVLHVRRDGRYFDFSGVSGLDFAEDSRAFAVTDFDNDGCPDLILKSRLGPQVRVLQNAWAGENKAIAFRLEGTRSNRDAIGARIEVDGQTKWLDAGSGFLSQHSKRVTFGLGSNDLAGQIHIRWPSGAEQRFSKLAAGHTYLVREGAPGFERTPFSPRRACPSVPVEGSNELALHDTWFLQPVPLPTREPGPGLFILDSPRPEYQIFRRYLFDWRTSLQTPFAMLLDARGDAVKVYAKPPDRQQVAADLARLGRAAEAALPFPGISVGERHRDFFKFGAAYLWAGDTEHALPYLERVLEQTPGNARVLVLVGQIHFQAKRFAEAGQSYRRALAASPGNVNALLGMGDVADHANQPAQAADYFGKALALDANSAEAANGLGRALAKQGRFDEGRRYLEQAIALKRDYADAVNNLGVLYTQQGKSNDAIAAFEYGIRVAPDEDILYLNLGRIYVQTGRAEKARLLMQQLLERKPGSETARRALEELNGR